MEFRNSSEVYYAEQLLQEGKRREAFNVLSDFVKRDPSSPQAWYLLSSLVSGDEKQLFCLERALKLDPSHPQARARLSQLKGTGSLQTPARAARKPAAKRSNLAVILLIILCLIAGALGVMTVTAQPELIANLISTPTFTSTSTSTITFTPPATITLTPTLTSLPTGSPFPTLTPITPLALLYSTWTPVPISADNSGVSEGLYAPDFSARLVGKEKTRINLADFTGNPILLVFWSNDSNIGPKHLSTVEQIFEKYRDQGLVVIAVGVNVDLEQATEVRDSRGLFFKMVLDPQGKIHNMYGNYELPLNIFIGKSRKIKSYQVGAISFDELAGRIEPLIKEPVTETPEPATTTPTP